MRTGNVTDDAEVRGAVKEDRGGEPAPVDCYRLTAG